MLRCAEQILHHRSWPRPKLNSLFTDYSYAKTKLPTIMTYLKLVPVTIRGTITCTKLYRDCLIWSQSRYYVAELASIWWQLYRGEWVHRQIDWLARWEDGGSSERFMATPCCCGDGVQALAHASCPAVGALVTSSHMTVWLPSSSMVPSSNRDYTVFDWDSVVLIVSQILSPCEMPCLIPIKYLNTPECFLGGWMLGDKWRPSLCR